MKNTYIAPPPHLLEIYGHLRCRNAKNVHPCTFFNVASFLHISIQDDFFTGIAAYMQWL